MPGQNPTSAIKAGRTSNLVVGSSLGALTIAALAVGRAFGKVTGRAIDPRVIAWTSAAVVLVAGVLAATRLSRAFSHLATRGSPAAGGAVRVVSGGAGYLLVLFAFLAVLEVQAEKLLVGAGLVGVVLGIAGQQSLGNVFAGLVLVVARPFAVGDQVRVRAGSLGGVFEGCVTEMSLTYVTLRVEDVSFKVPNSVMLSVGVGRLPVVKPPELSEDGSGPGSGASEVTTSFPGEAGLANDPAAPPGTPPQ
ncbi:MAG TPA: mechanosensitive ion channel family protein [Acidimicrobiales bacterium]|nr:mechanosensitive ion channel family protein [Acidimicrobiales bacterium]